MSNSVTKYQPESLTNFFTAIDKIYSNPDDVLVIFDIGSLHCLESIEFSKKYKNAKIYAFEANKESYKVCLENTKDIDNIIVINKCINDYDGVCKFFPINPSKTVTTWFDGNRGASSIFKANGAVDHIEKYVQDEVEMECIRLDTFCKENNITKINAIWMDLQGAELLALKGLGDMIDTVNVIQTELEINPMYENQTLFSDVNPFLLNKNFSLISGNQTAQFGSDFIYVKNNTKNFDVVLLVGPNEVDIINDVISHVKKNIKGYNKIFLISPNELNIDGCIVIHDNQFPFSMADIEKKIGYSPRISWIFQQLLKLYAINVIPNCLDNILILDSDVFILKELSFMDNDKPIFTVGYERTIEYHIHSEKLHPSLIRVHDRFSGVSHHMVFNKKYLSELFKLIEDYHNDSFFNVFLNSLVTTNINDIRCSEYEIYFNFMCAYHPDMCVLRELKWDNVRYYREGSQYNYDYISIPKYYGTR